MTFAPDFHVEISGPDPKSLSLACTNRGTIRWLSSGALSGTFGDAALYNEGLFQIEADCALNIGMGGTCSLQNSGTIKVPANLDTRLLAIDWDFSNYGSIDVETNSELNLSGNTLNTQFFDGTVFYGAGTVRFLPGGAGVGCFGTMTVNNTIEFQRSGHIFGPSTWTGTGLLRWQNGSVVFITFAPDFHVQISGTNSKSIFLTCTNQGTMRWLGGGPMVDSLGSAGFYNEGLFQIEGDGQWLTIPVINETSGVFRQEAGEFIVQSFDNFGTVEAATGRLTAAYSFTSESNSLYRVFLGGNIPLTNFNVLATEFLTNGGTLQVTLTNGFSPTNGSKIFIANDFSQTGRFASTILPALPSNLAWHVDYSPAAIALEVVPPPAVMDQSVTNGQFHFSFNGVSGAAYDIQVSSNLVDWTTVETNNSFSGHTTFTDTNAANVVGRYYRVRVFE
jgi:hypothetical protein